MAFTDMPVIDRSAIYSERSEHRFKEFINLDSGFQLRLEWPDKGCDFNLELVLDGQGASSQVFPVQLKSIEKPSLINHKTYISFPLETSRLGYLMRRLPSMGIVVLYSVEENKCFFDFVDKIYGRLMEERGSEDWKQNQEVSIHVPYANELSLDTARDIHQIMAFRFAEAIRMQNAFGARYNLPVYSKGGTAEYDFRSPEDIKRFLKESGMMLVNNYDVGTIYQMISQLSLLEIVADKQFLILAALSYQEAGYYSDAEFYCMKLRKFQLSPEEKLIIDFLKLKLDLSFGYIDSTDFLKGLDNLKSDSLGAQNTIVLKLNSIKYELTGILPATNIPAILITKVLDLFDEIEKAMLTTKTRTMLTLLHCQTLSHAIGHESGMFLGEMQFREKLNKPFSREERIKKAMPFYKWEELFNSILTKAYKTADELNDYAIKAEILAVRVFNYFQRQVNILSFDVPQIAESKEILVANINYGVTSYNYFLKVNAYKDAYDVLCNSIDLIELGEQHYGVESPVSKKQLYEIKSQMEGTLELRPRRLLFLKLIQKKKDQDNAAPHEGMPVFETMMDDQIHSIATKAHSAMRLPESHMTHLENEMKAYRLFHQRCKDPNIQILQQQTPDRYAQPVVFILRNKLSQLETVASNDMEKLLAAFGF